jgi:hypothetical protein
MMKKSIFVILLFINTLTFKVLNYGIFLFFICPMFIYKTQVNHVDMILGATNNNYACHEGY